MSRLFPENADSASLRVLCRRGDYSASRLAHAVEDCDAHLLNLNVTADYVADGWIAVELRVSIRNAGSVVRSLARYGYEASVVDGDDDSMLPAEIHEISALQRYLEI